MAAEKIKEDEKILNVSIYSSVDYTYWKTKIENLLATASTCIKDVQFVEL